MRSKTQKSLLENNEKNFPSFVSQKNYQNEKNHKDNNEEINWPHNNSQRKSENLKVLKNGDIFEGYYDENGYPIFGKIRYVNGNVYEGPIKDYWDFGNNDEDDIDDFDEDLYDEKTDTNYSEYSEEEYYDNYFYDRNGLMTYPDGKQFYGLFCFPDKKKW